MDQNTEAARGGLPQTGDIIRFGNCRQLNDMCDYTPIEWRVLEVREADVLLLSLHGLYASPMAYAPGPVFWHDSPARAALKHFFEQRTIGLRDEALRPCGVPGAEQDRLFLLSAEEMRRYLPSTTRRQCTATEYAEAVGIVFDGDMSWTDLRPWWLRPCGTAKESADFVFPSGRVGAHDPVHGSLLLRPALRADLRGIRWEPGRNDPARKYAYLLRID